MDDRGFLLCLSSWTDPRQLEVYCPNYLFPLKCFILLSRVITLEHLFTEFLLLPILTEGDKGMSIDLGMIWKF